MELEKEKTECKMKEGDGRIDHEEELAPAEPRNKPTQKGKNMKQLKYRSETGAHTA